MRTRSPQRKVLIVGSPLLALMLLFPPWDYFDSDTSGRRPAGYHFFLTPPGPRPVEEVFGPARYPHMTRVRLNDIRFILQLVITIPTIVGLLFLFEPKRYAITVVVGILFLLMAAFVTGFVIWVVVSEGLQYGKWVLPRVSAKPTFRNLRWIA